MRTATKFTRTALTIVFVWAAIFANAQTYFVNNQSTSCQITYDVRAYDFNIPNPGCVGTNQCSFVSGVVVPPSQNQVIPISGCTNICLVRLIITDIGGTPVTVFVNTLNTTCVTLTGAPAACVVTCVDFDPITNTFNIY
jgi:hypothetical protein